MSHIKQFSDGRDLRSFQETILGNYGFHVSKSLFQTQKFQIFSFRLISNMIQIINLITGYLSLSEFKNVRVNRIFQQVGKSLNFLPMRKHQNLSRQIFDPVIRL